MGTGSAMAHRAVDAVMGPRTIQHETVGGSEAPKADACSNQMKSFGDCLESSNGDIARCQFYFDQVSAAAVLVLRCGS